MENQNAILEQIKSLNICEDLGAKFVQTDSFNGGELSYNIFGDQVVITPIERENDSIRMSVIRSKYSKPEVLVPSMDVLFCNKPEEIEEVLTNYYFN
jgi:predicted PilT family ATPase